MPIPFRGHKNLSTGAMSFEKRSISLQLDWDLRKVFFILSTSYDIFLSRTVNNSIYQGTTQWLLRSPIDCFSWHFCDLQFCWICGCTSHFLGLSNLWRITMIVCVSNALFKFIWKIRFIAKVTWSEFNMIQQTEYMWSRTSILKTLMNVIHYGNTHSPNINKNQPQDKYNVIVMLKFKKFKHVP